MVGLFRKVADVALQRARWRFCKRGLVRLYPGVFFSEPMNQPDDLFFLPFGRGFEPIDITAEQGRVQSELPGESGDIDLFVGQEEPLDARRFGFGIQKTLETDVHVQLRPMDTDGTDFITGSFGHRRFQEPFVPEKGLAVGDPIVTPTVYPFSIEPYGLYPIHRF